MKVPHIQLHKIRNTLAYSSALSHTEHSSILAFFEVLIVTFYLFREFVNAGDKRKGLLKHVCRGLVREKEVQGGHEMPLF